MIISVFDVKNGGFVCGKSGEREKYSKLSSVYGENPLDIARNLADSGAKCVYIADLDKIESSGDNSVLIDDINSIIPVMLDNGASSIEEIASNKKICTFPILATETMTSIEESIRIFEENLHENIILSIDLKNNELLIKNNDIKLEDIISLVNKVKPAYTIILNISQVGTTKGNNDKIIHKIISRTPYTQHIIAGGVNNESITTYRKQGIDNFLVGTILHNGSLKDCYKW